MFKTLVRNINRAWPEARALGVVRGQLLSILMIFSLVSLMIFWVLGTSSIRILSQLPSWIQTDVQNNHTITRFLTNLGFVAGHIYHIFRHVLLATFHPCSPE